MPPRVGGAGVLQTRNLRYGCILSPQLFLDDRGRQSLYACSECWVQRRQNLKFRVDWHLTFAPSTSTRRSFAPDVA